MTFNFTSMKSVILLSFVTNNSGSLQILHDLTMRRPSLLRLHSSLRFPTHPLHCCRICSALENWTNFTPKGCHRVYSFLLSVRASAWGRLGSPALQIAAAICRTFCVERFELRLLWINFRPLESVGHSDLVSRFRLQCWRETSTISVRTPHSFP